MAFFGMGYESGRNAMSHQFESSADEAPGNSPHKKDRRRRHRTSPKDRALKARRQLESGGSDASDNGADADADDDDGNMTDSANSDADPSKDFAPPGAVKTRSLAREKRLKRISLTKNNTREAGLRSPFDSSFSTPTKKPQSILSHNRTKSSERVKFADINLVTYAEDTPAPYAQEDVDLASDADNDVYDQLNLITDSDEDEDQIEQYEADMLIAQLKATGEINEHEEIHELPFNHESSAVEEFLASHLSDVETAIDGERPNFGINFHSATRRESHHDTPIASIEMDTAPVDWAPFAGPSIPSNPAPIGGSDVDTGLRTPNSGSLLAKKFDDEETEEEDFSHHRIASVARVQHRSDRNKLTPKRPHRVRKTSDGKPKAGRFNVPKGMTCMRHKGDKLVVTKAGQKSDIDSVTLTPRGAVSRSSVPSTPIAGIPMGMNFFDSTPVASSLQTSPLIGTHGTTFFTEEGPPLSSINAMEVDVDSFFNLKDDHIVIG